MPTQHQMINVGLGNNPNDPLKYIAKVRFSEEIGTRNVTVYATGEIEAENLIKDGIPDTAVIDSLHIL